MTLDNCDRSFVSKSSASFRTLQLIFPADGVATFNRSREMKGTLALCFGVCAMLMLTPAAFIHFFKNPPPLGLLIVFESIAVLVFVGFLVGFLIVRPFVFDRNAGRVWRRGKADKLLGDYAPLRDIEGLQICSKMCKDTDGSNNYMAYELNLVMKRPPGLRVPVLCHGNRSAMFEDARKLAEFLSVPLVDHCLPEVKENLRTIFRRLWRRPAARKDEA